MDYRKFLNRVTTEVLPYFGGASVANAERRLRVARQETPGWWAFEISGRVATPKDPAAQADLSMLPVQRGTFAHGYAFSPTRRLDFLQLLSDEEPPIFTPVVARRWHGGELLFDSVEFETEVEENLRQALESRHPLDGVKGVTPEMRAAFAFALARRVGSERDILVSAREIAPFTRIICDGGWAGASEALDAIEEQRRQERTRQQVLRSDRAIQARAASAQRVERGPASAANASDRAADALARANADLLSHRRLGSGQLEVGFRFMGERFIAVVDALTLRVVDAGICLSGADRELNLDSLPSAIREAIETDQLYITRH